MAMVFRFATLHLAYVSSDFTSESCRGSNDTVLLLRRRFIQFRPVADVEQR